MSVTITVRGPILIGQSDPMVRRALRATIQEIVELGEQRLATKFLLPRPAGVFLSAAEAQKGKASRGNYRRNLHAESHDTLGTISDSGVLYGPWLEGTGSRNQTTRFKGYSSFRKTEQWMQEQAPKVAEAHARKLVRELGG